MTDLSDDLDLAKRDRIPIRPGQVIGSETDG